MVTTYLTSMDWTPSDSSSTLLFSRGPSKMMGASAGVGASSSGATAASARASPAAHTGKRRFDPSITHHKHPETSQPTTAGNSQKVRDQIGMMM